VGKAGGSATQARAIVDLGWVSGAKFSTIGAESCRLHYL